MTGGVGGNLEVMAGTIVVISANDGVAVPAGISWGVGVAGASGRVGVAWVDEISAGVSGDVPLYVWSMSSSPDCWSVSSWIGIWSIFGWTEVASIVFV